MVHFHCGRFGRGGVKRLGGFRGGECDVFGAFDLEDIIVDRARESIVIVSRRPDGLKRVERFAPSRSRYPGPWGSDRSMTLVGVLRPLLGLRRRTMMLGPSPVRFGYIERVVRALVRRARWAYRRRSSKFGVMRDLPTRIFIWLSGSDRIEGVFAFFGHIECRWGAVVG